MDNGLIVCSAGRHGQAPLARIGEVDMHEHVGIERLYQLPPERVVEPLAHHHTQA